MTREQIVEKLAEVRRMIRPPITASKALLVRNTLQEIIDDLAKGRRKDGVANDDKPGT